MPRNGLGSLNALERDLPALYRGMAVVSCTGIAMLRVSTSPQWVPKSTYWVSSREKSRLEI